MKELKAPLLTIFFIFLLLFIYTKLAGPIPFSVNSIQTSKTNLFQVSGIGKATAVPDTALISLGVTKTANTVSDAQNQTNTAANKIINSLKNLGVEEKNIKTTNYSINPDYQYTNGKQNITGYTATQNLEVKVKPIEKANQVIERSTADGANMIGNVSFVIEDNVRKDLENKARKEAVQDAKERAQSLADAAGIKLGRIIDVQENINQPYPVARGGVMMNAEKTDQSVNLTPGENTININISLFYETF